MYWGRDGVSGGETGPGRCGGCNCQNGNRGGGEGARGDESRHSAAEGQGALRVGGDGGRIVPLVQSLVCGAGPEQRLDQWNDTSAIATDAEGALSFSS